MSQIKVNTIRHTSATSDAITLANDGTCTANITNELGNRRININGAMNVSQRGTVTGITSSKYAGPDRYRFGIGSHGTYTVSQDSSAPTGSGFANSLKVACTTADTSVAAGAAGYIQHKVEGQDCQLIRKGTSSAKQLAVQFWVKSNKTGDYAFWVYDADNSRSFTTTYTISSADTWEKKTITVPADTTGALGNDNGSSLIFSWWLVAGSTYTGGSASATWGSEVDGNTGYGHSINIADSTSNTWYLTGFQVEIGSFHSSFEHRNYGDELARCQRYYLRYDWTASYQSIATAVPTGSAAAYARFDFPVEMRASPTQTESSAGHFRINSNASDEACNDILTAGVTTKGTVLEFHKTTENLNAYEGALISTQADNDASLYFDAEI